jgi:hypothetical protein
VNPEKSKVIADSVTKLFAPSVVFGEVEFEACAGVVGGDFAGVADEVAEEVGEGFFLGDGLSSMNCLRNFYLKGPT